MKEFERERKGGRRMGGMTETGGERERDGGRKKERVGRGADEKVNEEEKEESGSRKLGERERKNGGSGGLRGQRKL